MASRCSESRMQSSVGLVALLCLLSGAQADVVSHFEDTPECLKYFYNDMVPNWGANTPNVVRLCQRFNNSYQFATLYDTHHRIAVYSAYLFQNSNGGGRPKCWFVEPQLVNPLWKGEMKDWHLLRKVRRLGERQALYADYTNSGFDRGHLNPNGHHAAVPSRYATFTLTNVVPQNPKFNKGVWKSYESKMTKLLTKCSQAYVLVGAIPSADNWIVKNNTERVNIPTYLWNAYCCVDNNGKVIESGGGSANNTESSEVKGHTLDELEEFLQQFSNQPVGEMFHHNCR